MGDLAIEDLLIFRLHRAALRLGTIYASLSENLDVTPRQLLVLTAIADNKRASQSDIVMYTAIDRSTLSEMVRRLLRKQFVKRTRSAIDSRGFELSLTILGQDAMERALAVATQAEQSFCIAMPSEDRQKFVSLLAQVEEYNSVTKY